MQNTAGIKTSYSEYAAWLQRGALAAIGHIRIESGETVIGIAAEELTLGLNRIYGDGTVSDNGELVVSLCIDSTLPSEGYHISKIANGQAVCGGTPNGLLYGVFELLMRLAAGERFCSIDAQSAPSVPRRAINHWDNMNGTIERGYAGRSIFFDKDEFCYDPERIRDYARLLASVGLNVISINNVNVTRRSSALITEALLPEVAKVADIFRPYGIRLSLAVSFDSPVVHGGLETADPLSPEVVAWWQKHTELVYKYVPDFSGYLVKADSEFNSGPASVGRTQADGANMLAKIIAPFGGVIYWRCFIYNCLQDWRDYETDRPMAAYALFKPQDGSFEDNVILQVKNGPSDFQVREPFSPLFGAMDKTPLSLELQITQEYTGHQIDTYNLAVQWQEILASQVDDCRRLHELLGDDIMATAAVVNVGLDENWTGHTLSQLNLFAYGLLSWAPQLEAADVTRRWTQLTFGTQPELVDGVYDILMRSRYAYENYTTPLGLCWMVNPNGHYGASPEGYEFSKWGTYHRADFEGVGIDRSSRGTGFTQQYHPSVAAAFDNVDTCPEELLLFFHRLRYDFMLKNGKTLLQYIYDTHFEGADEAQSFLNKWDGLRGLLPESAYLSVRGRLERQLVNAREWRDVMNTYFFRKTGKPDAHGRKIYR